MQDQGSVEMRTMESNTMKRTLLGTAKLVELELQVSLLLGTHMQLSIVLETGGRILSF